MPLFCACGFLGQVLGRKGASMAAVVLARICPASTASAAVAPPGTSSGAAQCSALMVGTGARFASLRLAAVSGPAAEATEAGLTRQLEVSLVAPPSNPADDPSLGNPLLRLERMGCGWLGAILEWEGVLAEEDHSLGLAARAWCTLAEEEGRRPPPAFLLKRAAGMKAEQAVSEVLCWSRDPREVRRLASRWEELYECTRRSCGAILAPGSAQFVGLLRKNRVPVAVASTRRRRYVEPELESAGVPVDELVTAEDVLRGKPDPEMFMYAAQRLGVIPGRCIVFGGSNSSIEAAHDAGMKCVALASRSKPTFELAAADLVVRNLTELSFMDLKKLADVPDVDG